MCLQKTVKARTMATPCTLQRRPLLPKKRQAKIIDTGPNFMPLKVSVVLEGNVDHRVRLDWMVLGAAADLRGIQVIMANGDHQEALAERAHPVQMVHLGKMVWMEKKELQGKRERKVIRGMKENAEKMVPVCE